MTRSSSGTAYPCPQFLVRARRPDALAPSCARLKVIFCVRGAISPLLANIYMNRFLKYWRRNALGQRLGAHVVVYADDLVILCRRQASEAYAVLKDVMTRIGLSVNETKTKLREA